MLRELSALFERECAPVAQWIRAADFGLSGRERCSTERERETVARRVICSHFGVPRQLPHRIPAAVVPPGDSQHEVTGSSCACAGSAPGGVWLSVTSPTAPPPSRGTNLELATRLPEALSRRSQLARRGGPTAVPDRTRYASLRGYLRKRPRPKYPSSASTTSTITMIQIRSITHSPLRSAVANVQAAPLRTV